MAKIIGIRVTIGPGKNEDISTVTLIRDSDKLWFVEYTELNAERTRGLFPSEVRLANMIQEHIIHPWNQSEGSERE
jgi:hypothetical protein